MLKRVVAAAFGVCCAVFNPSATAGAPLPPQGDTRRETFELVWRTVNDRFFDPAINGVDWRAVHDEFAPRVAASDSDEQLYKLLNEMLNRLGASHFSIRPPESSGPIVDVDDASWGGGVGMTVCVVEGRATVTHVEPKGAADRAGIAPGDIVESVGEDETADFVHRARASETSDARVRFEVRREISARLGGMPGSPVAVRYRDGDNDVHVARLVRQGLSGRPMRFGDLPTVLVEIETRRLAPDIGYLRFNTFLPQLVDEIRVAVASFADCRAIVIDLRGNSGGMATVAPSIASLFLREKRSLGTLRTRTRVLPFDTAPEPKPYLGQLVILVDEATASTAEILAGSLQEFGRAMVVGEPTLGAVLPAIVQKLPTGAVFQFAVAEFTTPKGARLEGHGVIPDTAIAPRRSDLLAGRDAVLDAALSAIRRGTTK